MRRRVVRTLRTPSVEAIVGTATDAPRAFRRAGRRRRASSTAGAVVALLVAAPLARAATSDLLIVLEPDGRSYLAQHALSSEGEIVRVELPASVTPEHVRFSGPERATFAAAQRRRPGQLSLWSARRARALSAPLRRARR